jgi:hypothetical protein
MNHKTGSLDPVDAQVLGFFKGAEEVMRVSMEGHYEPGCRRPAESTVSKDHSEWDEQALKIQKIIRAVPTLGNANTERAVINFCKFQLRFEPEFRISENGENYTAQVIFPGGEVASFSHPKKKFCRQRVANIVLHKFLQDREFLMQQIQFALSQNNNVQSKSQVSWSIKQ